MRRTFNEDTSDIYPWKFWLTYIIFFALIISVCTEIIFINIAYSANHVTVVCPIHYVEFVSLSAISVSILYKYDWYGLGTHKLINIFVGFLIASAGCFMISISNTESERTNTPQMGARNIETQAARVSRHAAVQMDASSALLPTNLGDEQSGPDAIVSYGANGSIEQFVSFRVSRSDEQEAPTDENPAGSSLGS